MVMTNFLQKRKSVRNFKEEKVNPGLLDSIRSFMQEITVEDPTTDFVLYENGSIIANGLEGKAGYSGVMIHAPHYIALTMKNKTDSLNILNGGYYLEKLNTKIVDLDLDTCWITVDKVDDDTMRGIFGEAGIAIDYLIAFGYGQKKKLFDPEESSSRLPLGEIAFRNELGQPVDMEDLENFGLVEVFSSIRFAPSHKNMQPWRFVLKDSCVDAYMTKSEEDSRSLVDMGVALFYFEEMFKTVGHYGKWDISLNDCGKFLKVGTFKM